MIGIRYKLYKEVNPLLSAKQQVLYNRGIPVEKQSHWLNASWEDINDWRLLDNMELAVEKIIKQGVDNEKATVVLQDCDVDGINSTSILTNYLGMLSPSFVRKCVTIIYHEGKQHGLSDVMNEIPEETELVIIPDAGTNDTVYCKELAEKGIDIVILDHHESDVENPYATIVNPQMCDYPNKSLVGAGVTWQFCRAADELCGYDYANDLLDLCTLGQIGDMSDYRIPEVRAIVNLGLNNIKNKFFQYIVDKREYSLNKKNGVNYFSVAFYVVSLINAVCRSGTVEEKKLVLNAFLDGMCEKVVPSSKRGHKGEPVLLYEEAYLVAERAKRRQTEEQDSAMDYFRKQIADKDLTQNAMLFLIDKDKVVRPEIKGLIANKIQAEYQHPTAVVSKNENGELTGSIRNYGLSVNQDLKGTLESTGLDIHVAGHSNAAGLIISPGVLGDLNSAMNKIYKDIDQTPTYWVDYIWNVRDPFYDQVFALGGLDIYGQNIQESLVCLENIPLSASNITLMGLAKGHPTLKIKVNGVDIIKFHSSKEEYEEFISPGTTITLIAKPALNEWNGNVSPQLLVEDFELSEKVVENDFEEWVF